METKKCVQCGKVFSITDSEKKFYEDRNLSIPKRCKECREKNNPHKVKTNAYQITPRKERPFKVQIAFPIFALLLIAFSIFYFNSINSTNEYQAAPDNNASVSITFTPESKDSYNYTFASESLLQEHFDKHGRELGYASASLYESRASAVINSSDAMHKKEAIDGDNVYYIEATNELVVLSTEGYIRTYFKPEDGIDYYNRQ